MPLSIPTRKGITDTLRNYVRADLPALDPTTERRSFIGGLVKSLGSLLADFYIALKRYADREPYPQTATGTFLTQGWWVPITKLQPLPAAPARGYVVFTGTAGTVVPRGTQVSSSIVTFKTLDAVTIVSQPISAAIEPDAVNGVAIATTVSVHHLATGMQVVISGATQAAYNGTFDIVVTGEKTFTYEPTTLPGAAATGAPIATAVFASVEIEATLPGLFTNVAGGTTLDAIDPPVHVDSVAIVGYGGIADGADAETEDSYRARTLEALGTDYGMFSADEIVIVAKQVPGVTRVMVRQASLFGTNGVNEGQVKIAFLRDNDENPLPSASEVAAVKSRIVSLMMPAHTAEEDVMVMSPPPLTVNFQFASIVPDTPGMRKAVTAKLKQFFREDVHWGEVIPEDDYRCAILAAYDTQSRQKLKSFDLTAPSGDITPSGDEYPVLGNVTVG